MFFSNENTTNQTYLCASYSRLSQDDGDKEESNSIVNQKALIRDFMSEHQELQLVEEYADDGFSGVNFERPDFKRMMQDVKSQRINCIIVKDLSRFGRNYIETGKYLEQVFPFLGVRFIAINDSIDTSRAQSDAEQFVLPFKNLFNDSYCKDISTKVRSQLAIKRKNGDFVGSFASYGYVKDPGNHNQLIIDPEAAEVVRSIFTWKIQGLSAERISDKLNSLGVLCPMEYKRLHGMKVSTNFRTNDKAKWSPVSILRILKNELYVGVTTQGKTTTPSYKIKRLVEKPESEWDRVEGTHEAIISQDVFDAVQMLLMRDTRISPDEDQVYLFSGFLCCADCKLNMARRTRRYKEKVYSYYSCAGFRKKSGCTSHNISEKLLYDAVLAAIRQQYLLVADMERLLKYAQELPDDPNSLHQYEVQIAKLKDEIRRNQEMKLRLVENLNDGILTREEYLELSAIYDTRIRDSRLAIRNVETERDGMKDVPLENEWLTTFKKYQNVDKLDRVMLAELIQVIEVHENKQITVHFKFEDQIQRAIDYLERLGLSPKVPDSSDEKVVTNDGSKKQAGQTAKSSGSNGIYA
ncbi:MAG: recombinase family protein [Clostridiales bacterium]|nr:recombinase family protein [Clostridiales bacterium]